MLFPDLGESYEIQARAKERNKLDSKVSRKEGGKNPKSIKKLQQIRIYTFSVIQFIPV